MVDYQLKNAKAVDLTQEEFGCFYRGQEYSSISGEIREPIFFNMLASNRFNLLSLDHTTMYCGFKPLTGIVECIDEFRFSTLSLQIKLGRKRLERYELISFKLKDKLKLVNLCDEGALIRHRLKLDTKVLCSTLKHPESEEFAKQALKAGFDGIMFPTRQGVQKAVVIFGTAQSKLNKFELVDRMSFWEAFHSISDEVGDSLNIQLIDDKKPFK